MELIDRIKKDIDERLEELRPQIEEIPRLEAALAAFNATGSAEGGAATGERRGRGRPRAQRAGSARPGGRRRRARRGQRREELLGLMRGNPEITIAEAARQMGVSPPQVSTLVRRLRDEGTLERADGRFVVVESTTFSDDGGDSDGEGAPALAAGPETPAAEIDGPGVEGLGDDAGEDEPDAAEDAARDEAGRPQAT